MLDWRLSRKTYAIILAVLSGVLAFAALLDTHNLVVLSVLLLAMGLANNLNECGGRRLALRADHGGREGPAGRPG